MIKDTVFYPLAAIAAALLVLLALSPAFGALPSGPVSVGDGQYGAVSVSGLQLNRMQPGVEATLTLVESADPTAIEIGVDAETLSDDPVLGPHFPLAADLEVQFAGYEIAITVRAKPGPTRGATRMQVNYSTGRDGESGWQAFDLKPGYDDYTFVYDVPARTGEQGLDYLGIRPVVPDKSRTLLVEEVRFERRKRLAE
ncbi:MAG: hypothetical protein AAF253_00805 [Pseudomonadota bacterium]